MRKRKLGGTGLEVTEVSLGTSPLGNFPAQYGYEVSEDDAVATVRAVLDSPISFIDTSNEYGGGESESRIGAALAAAGGLPAGDVLATKVDPLPGSNDFSADRVRRSVEESLTKLGLDRLQLVYLHDPERMDFGYATASGGPIDALVALRDQGVIDHLGVAGGPIDLMRAYLATDVFEAVISHNRYTLVEQTAEPLIADAAERGVAFVNAAPYGGGMLVRGPDQVPNYCYRPAAEATRNRVRLMQELCEGHGVPLAAAALQFSLRDERICSTIVGMSAPERVKRTIELAEWQIPDGLWADLQLMADAGRYGPER